MICLDELHQLVEANILMDFLTVYFYKFIVNGITRGIVNKAVIIPLGIWRASESGLNLRL